MEKENFNIKIQELRKAVKDNSFMDDLKEISEAFSIIDSEGWPE